MPSYSGNAEEEGKLQGQFSTSLTQQLCRKPMEATQVTRYRVLVQPRGCFRNRQSKGSRQGSLSPVSLSQTSCGGVNAGKGPFRQPQVSALHSGWGARAAPSHTGSALHPHSGDTFEGQRQSSLSLTYYVNGPCDGDRQELCQLIAVVMRERNNPFSS